MDMEDLTQDAHTSLATPAHLTNEAETTLTQPPGDTPCGKESGQYSSDFNFSQVPDVTVSSDIGIEKSGESKHVDNNSGSKLSSSAHDFGETYQNQWTDMISGDKNMGKTCNVQIKDTTSTSQITGLEFTDKALTDYNTYAEKGASSQSATGEFTSPLQYYDPNPLEINSSADLYRDEEQGVTVVEHTSPPLPISNPVCMYGRDSDDESDGGGDEKMKEPISVTSPSESQPKLRGIKSPNPEQSFRLVNEELQSMFASSAPSNLVRRKARRYSSDKGDSDHASSSVEKQEDKNSIKTKVEATGPHTELQDKRNISEDSEGDRDRDGLEQGDRSKKDTGDEDSLAPGLLNERKASNDAGDKTAHAEKEGQEVDVAETEASPEHRSHAPLAASKSMYIVGPQLHQDPRQQFDRASTIDEEECPPSPLTDNCPPSPSCDIGNYPDFADNNKPKDTFLLNVESGRSESPQSGTSCDSARRELPVSVVEIHVTSADLSDREESGKTPEMAVDVDAKDYHADGASLYPDYKCNTQAHQALSRTTSAFIERPPSPPARSVSASPVSSIPCLASIEELDKSTSPDEDGQSDKSVPRKEFCKDRMKGQEQHYKISSSGGFLREDPARLAVNRTRSVFTSSSVLPDRRHSAVEVGYARAVKDSTEYMAVVNERNLLPMSAVSLSERALSDVSQKFCDGSRYGNYPSAAAIAAAATQFGSPSSGSKEPQSPRRKKRINKKRNGCRSSVEQENQSSDSGSSPDRSSRRDSVDGKMKEALHSRHRDGYKRAGKDRDGDKVQEWLEHYVASLKADRKKRREWTPPLAVRIQEHRNKILTQKSIRTSGVVLLKETSKMRVGRMSNFMKNLSYSLAPWGSTIRVVEGQHGAGVASYFLFLRWLFGFNLLLTVLMTGFIIIPMSLISEEPLTASTVTVQNTSYYCSLNYTVVEGGGVSYLLEFVQGTGWMEKTLAFYGYYVTELKASYNLPLAYVLTVLATMLVSLGLMARFTSKSFEEAILNSLDTNFEYSNKVFGAWDYGLTDAETATLKQKGIFYDLQSEMMEQAFMRSRMERLENKCSLFKLYTLRTIINLLIVFMLGAGAYAIVKCQTWSSSYVSKNADATGTDEYLLLVVQFLPSLTITVLNAALPLIFEIIVGLEDYSQAFVIKITLIRTVFLRLATLIVLLITLYTEITCGQVNDCRTTVEPNCADIKCWESYVGQQLYKLVIVELLVAVVKVFAVDFPRRLLTEKCTCGLLQKIGPPEFQITSNVLDLIYGQCLIWVGLLFCPFLPGMNVVKNFIMVYAMKFSAIYACPPSEKPFRASRINTFFMIILLLTYFLCAVPVLFSIFGIHPSRSCGPFRLVDYMNEEIEKAVEKWPSVLSGTYDLVTSAAFSGTVIIFLGMFIYYLNTMSKAHEQRAVLYKSQLIMEGRDKQFLLQKLQDQDKKMEAGNGNKKKSSPKKKPLPPNNPPRSHDDEAQRTFSPPHVVDGPEW